MSVVSPTSQAPLLAEILDVLPERVSRYRLADRVVLYCNAAWAAGHRGTPADLMGRPLDELLTPPELEGVWAQLGRLSRNEPPSTDPEPRQAPEDASCWIEWVDLLMPSPDGDEVLSIGRDVTARHEAQVRWGGVGAAVPPGHDQRPGRDGHRRDRQPAPGDQRGAPGAPRPRGRRARADRVAGGHAPGEPGPRRRSRPVRAHRHQPARQRPQVRPAGPIAVDLAPLGSGGLRLTVRDHGPGVPEDERERIFEPFPRVDEEHPQPGTGVGLALVADLVRLHDGRVWVEPIADEDGARFVIEVPGPSGPPEP